MSLVCWKCGASLADLSLPLQRLDECRKCGAELHVCKLCEFYCISVAKQCREPIAEEVKDKERANFCDYFTPRPNAYSNTGQAAAVQAKSELEALFGTPQSKKSQEESPGESPGESHGRQSPEDRARSELESLFKKK